MSPNIVTLPSRSAIIHSNIQRVLGRDRERLEASTPMADEPSASKAIRCLALCTDWQDTAAYPGWTMPGGTTSYQPLVGGTLPKASLIDGGYVHVMVAGNFTANSANPSLLVRCNWWEDFYGTSPSATVIGPAAGWGFTNSQTGIGTIAGADGAFLLDVKMISLGMNKSSDRLLCVGNFYLGEIADDGGLVTPHSQFNYEIFSYDDIALEEEYEITLDITGRVSSSGTDDLHIDTAGIWAVGSQVGIDN